MNDPDNRSAAQLFNNSAFSDVKIKHVYNGHVREYFAHKAVLCLESRYFLKMFEGGFKEATTQVIELHDDDPDHFEFILKYIYTYRYDTGTIVKLAADDLKKRVMIPISVHAVADKYDVPRIYGPITIDIRSQLNTYAFELIKTAISAHYASVTSVGGLMGKTFSSILLESQRKFTDTPEYRELVISNPAFGADMALALAQDTINWQCTCGVDFVIRSDTQMQTAPHKRLFCSSCSSSACVIAKPSAGP